MIGVGLTGGIATGKTQVAHLLRAAGVPVLDADLVAREVVAPGQPALEQVVRRFGDRVLASDGHLDRSALGRIVMTDSQARSDLEAILHPAIGAAVERWLQARRDEGANTAVVDAALMVETGSFRRYDVILVVRCQPELQLARLMARQGINEEEARRWLAAQLGPDEKARRVQAAIDSGAKLRLGVIDNSGELSELRGELARAWEAVGVLGAWPG
jgi:dephospho-CoA kinase